MGHERDAMNKLILSALARHGPLQIELIASYVEGDRLAVTEAVELLRKEGRVEATTGKKTKRYKIRETAPGA